MSEVSLEVQNTVESLKRNGFDVKVFESKEKAREWLVSQVKERERVGIGGSLTIRQIGVVEALKEKGITLYDHWEEGLSPEEVLDTRKKQIVSDVFITSSNAITQTGEIVNREGVGNRINAMTFGPGRVYIVVGKNKIVKDVNAGIERIKKISAPLRSKNLNTNNPCVEKGECIDCSSPTRICRITHIIHRCPVNTNITIIIVLDELGF